MTEALAEAVEALTGKDVLISYSCGKDSLICLDIASRVAKRVSLFTMELVPGISILEERIAWTENRYGFKIRRYPHWLSIAYAREGVYCFHTTDRRLDINDIYEVARQDAGTQLIATGAKKGDSLWRRRSGATKFANASKLVAPLWNWSNRAVWSYMAARKLPKPDSDGRNAGGIDLSVECVLRLHREFPDDYKKLEARFPFIGAIVLRRDIASRGTQTPSVGAV